MSPQVEATASNLNTNDAFVLKSPNGLYVWRGVGASDEEMGATKHVVSFLGGSASQVAEGKEPGGWSNMLLVVQKVDGPINKLKETYSEILL